MEVFTDIILVLRICLLNLLSYDLPITDTYVKRNSSKSRVVFKFLSLEGLLQRG